MLSVEDCIAFVLSQETDECIYWPLSARRATYAKVLWNGRIEGAHRIVWEASGRGDPGEMDIHHKCRKRGCVNPRHLEMLTHKAHMRLHNRRRLCPRGHVKRETPKGVLYCVRCTQDAVKRWREQNPEKARELDRVSYERKKQRKISPSG